MPWNVKICPATLPPKGGWSWRWPASPQAVAGSAARSRPPFPCRSRCVHGCTACCWPRWASKRRLQETTSGVPQMLNCIISGNPQTNVEFRLKFHRYIAKYGLGATICYYNQRPRSLSAPKRRPYSKLCTSNSNMITKPTWPCRRSQIDPEVGSLWYTLRTGTSHHLQTDHFS